MASYERQFIEVLKDYLTEGVHVNLNRWAYPENNKKMMREKSFRNFNRFLEFENLFTFKDKSIDCVICRGIDLEKCPSCEKGRVICETCEGSARVLCVTCEGDGELICEYCNHDPCLRCGGEGLLFDEYYGLELFCDACLGSGLQEWCGNCDGGIRTCRSCYGEGEVTCQFCDYYGSGKKYCNSCGGEWFKLQCQTHRYLKNKNINLHKIERDFNSFIKHPYLKLTPDKKTWKFLPVNKENYSDFINHYYNSGYFGFAVFLKPEFDEPDSRSRKKISINYRVEPIPLNIPFKKIDYFYKRTIDLNKGYTAYFLDEKQYFTTTYLNNVDMQGYSIDNISYSGFAVRGFEFEKDFDERNIETKIYKSGDGLIVVEGGKLDFLWGLNRMNFELFKEQFKNQGTFVFIYHEDLSDLRGGYMNWKSLRPWENKN